MFKEFGEFLNAHLPGETLVGSVAFILFIVCGTTVFVLFFIGLAELAFATHWVVVPLVCIGIPSSYVGYKYYQWRKNNV